MSKINCVICDDESIALEGLYDIVAGQWNVVGQASNGNQALALVKEHQPQAIFLDISMPGLSGLDAAKAIREIQPHIAIIFVTAYDQYAIQAFELYAIDYVLKPYKPARILESLNRVETLIEAGKISAAREVVFLERLFIPSISKVDIVEIEDVHGFVSNGNYVEVIMEGSQILHRASIKHLEENLDPAVFIRCHRSCIVRVKSVVGVNFCGENKYELVLKNARTIKMSSTYKASVMDSLENSVWEKKL